ncbi:MAG: dTDP-4-dehydrorhamnose 3,5-epimerase [Candidatus Limnocylindrales bacterium]
MPFIVEATAIPEVRIVRPRVFADERGWFTELFQAEAFAELGLPTAFVQVNQSRSTRGVVRGLHFQWDPPQGKLMRVVRGRAFLVAVDVRPGSPTLGRSVTVEADADEPLLLWAPATFARGFAALSDVADIEYFCTAGYNPASESGIRFDDPDIGISWPVEDPRLSPRDAAADSLADWLSRPESAAFRYRAPG